MTAARRLAIATEGFRGGEGTNTVFVRAPFIDQISLAEDDALPDIPELITEVAIKLQTPPPETVLTIAPDNETLVLYPDGEEIDGVITNG